MENKGRVFCDECKHCLPGEARSSDWWRCGVSLSSVYYMSRKPLAEGYQLCYRINKQGRCPKYEMVTLEEIDEISPLPEIKVRRGLIKTLTTKQQLDSMKTDVIKVQGGIGYLEVPETTLPMRGAKKSWWTRFWNWVLRRKK